MFQIYLEPVWQAWEELGREWKTFRQANDEVDSAIQALQSMRGFESVIPRCREQKEQMDMAREQLRQMEEGLENVILHYKVYEDRIVDNVEKSVN